MFIVLLLILGFEPFAAAGDPLEQICNTSIPYNSTYQANLELLSTVLSRNASSTGTNQPKGFVRTDQDPIYGVAQCPGDTIASACSSCITTAFHDAWRLCGSQMDMHFLYGDCIVHVSTEDLVYNSSFVLHRLLIFRDTTDPSIQFIEITNFTDASIDGNIKVLLQETAKQAAYNSTMMYATGRLDLSEGLPLLYSMAQCNLDLRPNDCWDCLDNIRSAARGSFHEQHGEWIAGVWCNFRYSTYQFYNDQPTKKTGWSDVVDPTTNMPAPGPVGVPRQKDKNFGLAKIFSSNDTEGNTKRIAGTYGYMAPEYASEGLFSIKSDVFSFGVLILEIINGKRNSCFHQNGDFFNLLGYAWKLWKEERWLEFVDESIVSESDMLETMRCINIALLCVQENAVDRPSTTSVVAMLSSETMALPEPKHPAYFGYGGRAT
ncbi:cysteine-rich receptor-like protein kinase 6 [Triticum aestivum]|uniref:cysteine-rich receptor-like protein kinase 6 n=1 Tax=Triticum aestivum TaxID=4565 RepID=UPI001D02FA4B|nr:cysteine-rich receptor-like protein kinase 6 [Triticum aestivum]